MNKFFTIAALLFIWGAVGTSFADEASPSSRFTIKANGGYNVWIIATAFKDRFSSGSDISTTGISFGLDGYYGDPHGFQFGIGAQYLPVLGGSAVGKTLTIFIVPITIDLLFNSSGPFYFNLGGGLSLIGASSNDSTAVSFLSKSFQTVPAPVGKIGFGLDFQVTQTIGIDLGTDLFISFSDYGLSGGQLNTLYSSIVFVQSNTHLGINIDL